VPLYKQIEDLSTLKNWQLTSNHIESHVTTLCKLPYSVSKISSVSNCFPLEMLLQMPKFKPKYLSVNGAAISELGLEWIAKPDSVKELRFDEIEVEKIAGLPPLEQLTLFRPSGTHPKEKLSAFKTMLRHKTANPLPVKSIGHQRFDMAEERFWWGFGPQIEWWWPEPH
jgi:hypothetical protein